MDWLNWLDDPMNSIVVLVILLIAVFAIGYLTAHGGDDL